MARADQTLQATEFEHIHQTLIHFLIVGAAWSTYLIDRDDVVWRFIRNQGAATRPLEHSIFLVAALLTGFGGYICTIARLRSGETAVEVTGAVRTSRSSLRDNRLLHYYGEGLYALGFASLVPLPGFIILILGEMIRLARLTLRHRLSPEVSQHDLSALNWPAAIRLEVLKWGIFISMTVFSITLQDRHADVLIAASFLVWIFTAWRFRYGARRLA